MKLRYLQLSNAVFAYKAGDMYVAIKECRIRKYRVLGIAPLQSFILEMPADLDSSAKKNKELATFVRSAVRQRLTETDIEARRILAKKRKQDYVPSNDRSDNPDAARSADQ